MSVVIVVGGAGALGKAILKKFSGKVHMVISVDFKENPEAVNFSPDSNCKDLLAAHLNGSKADLIVNAAGGWTGGNLSDPEFPSKCQKMWEMNVETSILTAELALKHLSPAGLLVFVGAYAVAAHPTPDMLAYAMAKSAVTSLARNLSQTEKSGLPLKSRTMFLLPEILLTQANLEAMPGADTSKWTPTDEIAAELFKYVNDSDCSLNGASIHIQTRQAVTKFIRL